MEIETGQRIMNDVLEAIQDNGLTLGEIEDKYTLKKWVAVDDLIKFIDDSRIGYDKRKPTVLQGDWNNVLTMIERELSQS